jgi:hypothetical protein
MKKTIKPKHSVEKSDNGLLISLESDLNDKIQ